MAIIIVALAIPLQSWGKCTRSIKNCIRKSLKGVCEWVIWAGSQPCCTAREQITLTRSETQFKKSYSRPHCDHSRCSFHTWWPLQSEGTFIHKQLPHFLELPTSELMWWVTSFKKKYYRKQFISCNYKNQRATFYGSCHRSKTKNRNHAGFQ